MVLSGSKPDRSARPIFIASVKMNLNEQLSHLFNPKSVAVIGASNTFGKWGFNIMGRVLQSRGDREVYPVNRKDPGGMGLKAYKNLLDVPYPVDFAVITVPSEDVPAAMQDCVQKGVKTAVVITGGLAESGEEGARVEREVVEIARRGGVRFVGPNCLGHFDAHSGFCPVAFLPKIKKGNVALISQ